MTANKTKNMIPIGIILIAVGFISLIVGVNAVSEAEKPLPVAVGEQWLSADPFLQNHPYTVLETSGDWVKYRQQGDAEFSFRSCSLTQFRAWYPNRYVKTP